MAAFSTKRYLPCETGDLEDGFEKIAIYADSSTQTPKHAAHQLRDGSWESKLGSGIDIIHESLAELFGPTYGDEVHFLKRAI